MDNRPKMMRLNMFATIVKSIGNKKTHKSEIQAETKIFYSHINNVMKELLKRGLVEQSKSGRIVCISLTEKGLQLLDTIYKMEELLKLEDQNGKTM